MSINAETMREHLFKVLVIGDLSTGKTSFIKRYVHQFYSPHYRATIGVDFALKVIRWSKNSLVRIQLWDIAGTMESKLNDWSLPLSLHFLINYFASRQVKSAMARCVEFTIEMQLLL